MAIVVKDRVKVVSATTGTADFILGGAPSGFQTFAAIGNNNFTYYAAVDPATGDWEVGYGQYTTSGPTLTRNTILSSSAAGAKISFGSGDKDVFCTYPSEKAIYEELSGNVLIDGGPLTVVGSGVTSYTSFGAALAEMYANETAFAQMYVQNLNSSATASTDIVAYNDAGDGTNNFIDMGISSANYSDPTYEIFTPGSGYLYNDGGELIIGSATDDVVLFAGGVALTDEAARIDKTTKAFTTVADVNVGGALDVVGATTFGSTVTLDADPTTNLEAATKQYVDTQAAQGFTVHASVVLATTTALTNAPTYAAGVYTATTNGKLTIDGVDATNGQRVLIKNEVLAQYNGVYDVTSAGSAGSTYQLTRSSDMNAVGVGEVANNAYFFVTGGTSGSNKYTAWVLAQTAAITLGVTPLPFDIFSSQLAYTGGTNIDVTGTVISLTGTVAPTNGGTGVNTVTTGDLLYGSAANTWSKLPLGSAYRSLSVNGAGNQVEWNAVALDQSNAVSGTLPVGNGGTGITGYAQGEMLFANTATTLDKVTANTTTTKKFLSQTGTGTAGQAPNWQQPAATDITGLAPSATTDTTDASNITSGTLGTSRLSGSYTGVTGVGTLTAGTWNASTIGAAYGGTGFASYAVGDLLYADTTTSLAKLADVAVGNALISGGVSANPSWGKIGLATHVDGTLPVANGGTGNTTGNAPTATTATTAIAVTATAASGIQSAYQASINTTTPGLGTYGIHFNGQTTADFASGITWNGGTTSTNSQAGIYVQGSGAYGTKMYIATTDSYATGAKSAISIDHLGNVNILRGAFTSPQIATNTTTTYGGATQSASKAGYYGYLMGNATSHLNAMADGSGNGGFYRESSGTWPLYYLTSNASVGIMGSTTSASAALYVNGAMIATGNITAYSDRRMKKDIVTIDGALEKTNKLRGVYYKKIKEDVKDEAHHDKRQMGVIAQEVLDVAPEVVVYDKENDKYTVAYANMAGLFIEAIKELTGKVAMLEAKIAELTKE